MSTVATLQGMVPAGNTYKLSPAIMLPNVIGVSWKYDAKTNEKLTVGGKVIQAFGITVSDVVIKGTYTPYSTGGGYDGRGVWHPHNAQTRRDPRVIQQQFLHQVEQWARGQVGALTDRGGQGYHNGPPLKFLFRSTDNGLQRNWDLNVYITDMAELGNSISMSVENFHPAWQMTLFIENDNGTLQAEKDALLTRYINRMSETFGWFPNQYNGPVAPGQYPVLKKLPTGSPNTSSSSSTPRYLRGGTPYP